MRVSISGRGKLTRAPVSAVPRGAGAVTARKEVAKPESSSELQHELDRLRVRVPASAPCHKGWSSHTAHLRGVQSRLSSLEREILANVQGGAAGELPSGEAVTSL